MSEPSSGGGGSTDSPAAGAPASSADYIEDNLLDRHSNEATMEVHYAHMHRRERELLAAALPDRGDALSVGCGWDPGRHLFPSPRWRLTGTEVEASQPTELVRRGVLDAGHAAAAGELVELLGQRAFDAVYYRLVLHHIAYQGPLEPVFEEASRLLRPGGTMIAVEPGSWHPVGLGLSLANRVGLGTKIHGTPDDIPLSPRALLAAARSAGLDASVFALTYSWRRMPPGLQRAIWPLDRALGRRPRAARLGHTLVLVARRR